MARACTCIRCKAEEFVRGVYPKMDGKRVLSVATDIVKALRSSVDESRRTCFDVSAATERNDG